MATATPAISSVSTDGNTQTGKRPAAGGLGTLTKTASRRLNPGTETSEQREQRERQARLERWRLQGVAGRVLPKARVRMCMRCMRKDVATVKVLYAPATQSAHYGGLMACGSIWVCPVCAAKVTERRRRDLAAGVKGARAQGLRVLLLTYTFRHRLTDPLKDILGRFLKAYRRMQSGRAWQTIRQAYAPVGSVRALEVTRGVNGWHPHIHQLVFLPEEVDAAAYAQAVRGAWEAAAASLGLTMNDHGFDWTDTNEAVSEYLAKWGHDPAWTEANEMTKWHVKKGEAGGRSPFQLLRDAGEGDTQAAGWFREYAAAFKGQKQLHWTPGLRALLGLGKDKSDQELAEEQEEEATPLIELEPQQWQIVVANDCRGELLDVARRGDAGALWEWLGLLGVAPTHWQYHTLALWLRGPGGGWGYDHGDPAGQRDAGD